MNYKVEVTLFIFVIFLFMKSENLRAFTFVELIITLSILALLSVIGYTAVGNKQENTLNTKITSEVETLKNALLLAKQENSVLPLPDGNNNFYAIDTSYSHDYENENTYGVHGFITQNTLAKKYIDVIPLDPRTNSYYAYGKTKGSEMYEIASVIFENQEPKSKVIGDYTAIEGPFNLIREYNGPYFVDDNSTQNFAYNPYEKILTAKIGDNSGNITVNGKNLSTDEISNIQLVSGDTIKIPQDNNATIYFSDGTTSILGDTSQETQLILQNLEFPSETNLITKIQLVLQSGMIWNKAASLDEESQFEIYTIDSTAAVRGTVFGVQKNSGNSKILVSEGKVAVYKNYEENLEKLLEKISTNKTISREQVSSRNNNVITIDEETQESIIEVESDESIKGVQIDTQSQGEIEPTNDSLEDIPEEIKKDIIDNRILFSKNIGFGVDTLEINEQGQIEKLVLKMQKKVWDGLDKISISSSLGSNQGGLSTNIEKNYSLSPIEKNNQYFIDLSNDIKAGYISYHLPTEDISQENTISIFSTANADYTKQVGDKRGSNIDLNTNAEITTGNQSPDIITISESDDDTTGEPKNLGTITIQLVQTRNGKNFESKSVTVPLVKDTKISQEKPKDELPLLVREKPILPPLDEDESESECSNPFGEEKQYCWEKTDGIDDDFTLAYYAPYDVAGDISIYDSSFTYKLGGHSSITGNNTSLPDYCVESSDESNSFCIQSDGTKGIFIDNEGGSWTNKDYIKYQGLALNNDFIFEINVRGKALNRSTGTYFLFSNEKVKLYLHDRQLTLKIDDYEKGSINIPYISLGNSRNYSVLLIKNDNEIGIQLSDTSNSSEYDYQNFERDFNYIGVNKDGIKNQWNDVINYIKIYEK